VSVRGGRLRKLGGQGVAAGDGLFARLPLPELPDASKPFNVFVTGIGGSGVVTVGALLGMAAHLEGRGCSVLDVTGLAQKNGPVTSHVRIADDPSALHATRIAAGAADLLLGCDVVVASNADSLSKLAKGRTTAVVNTFVAPTSDFARSPDLDLSSRAMEGAIRDGAGDERCHFVAATPLATALLGDALAANLFLVGYAFQKGRIPLGLGALERAIELNARSVEMNKRAFAWGRLAAFDPAAVEAAARPLLREAPAPERQVPLEELVARRAAFLTEYQNAAYARRYAALVERVAARERAIAPGSSRLAEAVARADFKLLAYKDEYEVARLYTNGELERQIELEFEGGYALSVHLAPQFLPGFLAPRDGRTGRVRKWEIPAWLILPIFRVMARLRFLRGTPFDPFGWTAHRRLERELATGYEARIAELLAGLSAGNLDLASQIAGLPEQIRGFDTVKEQSLAQVREKEQELLAAFRALTT
jgi:indolepyruvate ferredoxin oxidoreductase